jgi:hypothetical protein
MKTQDGLTVGNVLRGLNILDQGRGSLWAARLLNSAFISSTAARRARIRKRLVTRDATCVVDRLVTLRSNNSMALSCQGDVNGRMKGSSQQFIVVMFNVHPRKGFKTLTNSPTVKQEL